MNRILLQIYFYTMSVYHFIYNHTWRHILVWNDKRIEQKIHAAEQKDGEGFR